MILTLIRETNIEVPHESRKTLERMPIITADSIEAIDEYCDSKEYRKVSGVGVNSVYESTENISTLNKERVQAFFKTTIPMKISERFVIFEAELRSKS